MSRQSYVRLLRALALGVFLSPCAFPIVTAEASFSLLGAPDVVGGEVAIAPHAGTIQIPYGISISEGSNVWVTVGIGSVRCQGGSLCLPSVIPHESGPLGILVKADKGGLGPYGISRVTIRLELPAGTPCPILRRTYVDIGPILPGGGFVCQGAPLQIATPSLQDAFIGLNGESQSQTLLANGGTPPYKNWGRSNLPDQPAPTGMVLLSTTGQLRIAPVPNSPEPLKFGTYTIEFLVEDSSSPPQVAKQTMIWKVVCGVSADQDTDQDGLKDCWELGGIDIDNDGKSDFHPASVVPSVSMPKPSPTVKDIFLEVDWMQGHEPPLETLETAVAVFKASPSQINLHIVKSDQISHRDVTFFGPVSEKASAPPGAPDFDDIKRDRFGLHGDDMKVKDAKKQVFHYALFVHKLQKTTANGRAEILGNDLVIAGGALDPGLFGFVTLRHTTGTPKQLAGILVHELGHNLGLQHGGDDESGCKPNYLSVMNYTRILEASPIRGLNLSFSPVKLDMLNEINLNEPSGLQGHSTPLQRWLSNQKLAFGPPITIAVAYPTGPQLVLSERPLISWAGAGIDWNNDTDAVDLGLSFDINNIGGDCDGRNLNAIGLQTGQPFLFGFEDWPNMVFNFRPFGDFADSTHFSLAASPDLPVDQLFRWSLDDDGDGVNSLFDNCPYDANPNQEDTNGDGRGDACQQRKNGDVDEDREVNCQDLRIVQNALGSRRGQQFWDSRPDLNNDGIVDARDLQIVARALPAGTVCQ